MLLDMYTMLQSLSQAQPALSQHQLGIERRLTKCGTVTVKDEATSFILSELKNIEE